LKEVEPNVVLARAIGAKDANALFALAAFVKLPKRLTFGHHIFINKGLDKPISSFCPASLSDF
jgi:hypothetical protein